MFFLFFMTFILILVVRAAECSFVSKQIWRCFLRGRGGSLHPVNITQLCWTHRNTDTQKHTHTKTHRDRGTQTHKETIIQNTFSRLCLDFLVSKAVSPLTRLDSTSDTLCQSSSWSQANFDFSTFFIFEEKHCNTIVSDRRKTWTWNFMLMYSHNYHKNNALPTLISIAGLTNTKSKKICQTFEIFGTTLVLQNLSKEENWSQYVCSRERGASIQILMFVFLFCNSSKRKKLFFPAKNSLSKCQHNFLWASRETKAESSIFLVIAQRVKHFLL